VGGGEVEIRLLGRFSVRRGGEEVPPGVFGGRLVRRLIRVLLTARGAFVSRDALTEALWPAHPPADPAANLNVLVNRARRALGSASLIVTGPAGYSFAAGPGCQVDAEAFLARAAAARGHLTAGRAAAALHGHLAALDLWTGEPLAEDAYEDWAAAYRGELERAHLEVLEGGALAALAAGDPTRAVALAEHAAARAPLREPASLLLARSLAAAGDQAAALETLAAFRRRFAGELGLDPSAAAADLEARILRGEALPRPEPVPHPPQTTPTPARPDELAFVGRDDELAALLSVAEAAGGAVAVLLGPAGAGKSRLLAEAAARSPVPVLAARAFLAEREQPWGLARSLLREALASDAGIATELPDRAAQALADVVPELEELRPVEPVGIEPASRRALAMEGAVLLLGACARSHPLLCVDDLQWADATSLALLHRAADRLGGLRLVLACRSEELPPDGMASSFLADLGTGRELRLVELPPLAAEAIGELVAGAGLARTIATGTDGTPLAVAEVLGALARQGAVTCNASGRFVASSARAAELALELARAGQRRAILARAARQAGPARELLGLLALLGRDTPGRLLAAAAGVSQEEALARLDRLARSGLVRHGERGWAPAHDLIGEAVAEQLSKAERGRLHGLLANALKAEGEDLAGLAEHLAGAGDRTAAAAAYANAARGELERYADGEAGQLADAGLALRAAPASRSRLLEVRAEVRARRGDLAGARQDLRDALAGRPRGPQRARILARSTMLASGSEDLVHAADLAALAVAEAGDDPATRAEALAVAAIIDMNTGAPERARARSEEALALFERLGDARGIAGILDGRAMATFLDGRIREGVDAFDRAARLFLDAGELLRVGTPRSTRGHGLVFMAAPERGLVDIDAALDLERQLGNPEGTSYCLWHRTEALAALGRVDDALASASEALALAQRLGHRGWTATGLRALGIACQAAGDLDGAEAAFHRSLETSQNLPLFAAWAAARLALVRIAKGDPDSARPSVARALRGGPPLGHYEARLAEAELAAALGDRDAPAIAARALTLATAGGHLASAARLHELQAPGQATSGAR